MDIAPLNLSCNVSPLIGQALKPYINIYGMASPTPPLFGNPDYSRWYKDTMLLDPSEKQVMEAFGSR